MRRRPDPCTWPTTLGLSAGLLLALSLGCGPGDRSTTSGPDGGPERAEAHPVERFQQLCPGDAVVDAECTGIFLELCNLADERSRPIILTAAPRVCREAGGQACRAAVDALVAMADAEALSALLELVAVPASEGVLRFDEALLGSTMSELCDAAMPQPGCERLVAILAEQGVGSARSWQEQEALRSVIAEAVHGGRQRAAALEEVRARGESCLPILVALIADGRLNAAEESIALDGISSFGVAGKRRLVEIMKHGELRTSMAAASVEWDSNAHEREDSRRAAGEEAARTVYLDEAVDTVGKNVRIELKDGSEREGMLTKVDDERLYLQIPVGAGSVGYSVKRTDVAKIRF